MLRRSSKAFEVFHKYTKETMHPSYKKSPVAWFVSQWVGVIENGEPVIYVKSYVHFPKEIDGVRVCQQYDYTEMPQQDWSQKAI